MRIGKENGMEFKDLGILSNEEKISEILTRYEGRLKAAGRKTPVIDKIQGLNSNTRPNPEKLAVLEGIWAIDLALRYSTGMKYVIVCPERIRTIEAQRLLDSCINVSEECYYVSERVYDVISEKEGGHGLMAVCYLRPKTFDEIYTGRESVVMVLDGLEIPGNVGTILRSCEATAADLVIITNRKTRLNHPKLIRSSMGAVFKVPVVEASYEEAFSWLGRNGYRIILTDTAAEKAYYEADYKGRIAIVMGSEKYGVSEGYYNLRHEGIMIPMLGDLDSLNVGVAATIVLYEASLKNKGYMKR
jgi:TrmH family RNA methyltransferase